MVYEPLLLDTSSLEDKLAQNIFRLVTEFKVSNSHITFQDSQVTNDFPAYIIYVPEIDAQMRDMRSNNQKRVVTINIEFVCKPTQGYRQLALMSDAFEAGLYQSNDLLRTARLRYKGSNTVAVSPLDISGQQLFTKVKSYIFEVLL